MPDHVHSQPRKPQYNSTPAPTEKPTHAQFPVVRLQGLIGNQATQRLLQREGWQFNPVPPNLGIGPNSPNSASQLYGQPRNRVEVYLNNQLASLKESPKKLLEILGMVRQGVKEATQFETIELQLIIINWANLNSVVIQSANSAQATPQEAAAAAASGLSLGAAMQVSKDDKGQVKIALVGNVELLKKLLNLQFEIGDSTKLGFEIQVGDLKLGASMDKESWEFKLEYGEADIPSLSSMSEMIFTTERVIHEALSATVTGALQSGRHVPQAELEAKVKTSVGEKAKKVAQAASAAKEGKAAKSPGFKIDLTVKGPNPAAKPDDPAAAAISGTVNLTVPF